MNRILLIAFIALSSSVCRGAVAGDTTVKKDLLQFKTIQDKFSDYANAQKAVAFIRQDSVDKGIQLLATVAKHSASEKNINRVLPYLWTEFLDLLSNTNSSKLSDREKLVWFSFFKVAFDKDHAPTEQQMETYLKKAPNTLLIERMKVLILSIIGGKQFDTELNKLLKEAPDLLSVNILKADVLYGENKYEESIKYSTRAIDLFPQYAYAFDVRAKCYGELNDQEKALADYNKAIELFPDYYEAYYNRADILLDQDKYRAAIEGYKKTLTYSPNYNWCNYNLARCYRRLDMADSALYYIDIHINENPADGDGYDVKGDIYNYNRHEYDKAIDLYSQAVKADSAKYTYREDRADAYDSNKQFDEAIKDFEKAAELNPKKPYPVDRIGDVYYEKKEYEKSIAFHEKAIGIDSSYKYAYAGLAITYVDMKDYQAAFAANQKAIEIDSTYSLAIGNLGWTYYCLGKFDDCITYSYKALKYEPDSPYAMFNIALATLRKGDFEKARQLYVGFIKTCNDSKYEINDGAVDDLRNLIKEKIYVDQSTYIIEKIFGKTP